MVSKGYGFHHCISNSRRLQRNKLISRVSWRKSTVIMRYLWEPIFPVVNRNNKGQCISIWSELHEETKSTFLLGISYLRHHHKEVWRDKVKTREAVEGSASKWRDKEQHACIMELSLAIKKNEIYLCLYYFIHQPLPGAFTEAFCEFRLTAKVWEQLRERASVHAACNRVALPVER